MKRKRESLKDREGPAIAAAADFPIVGIGASAGGLAAFEAFFSAIPAGKNTGMAFVLVQHLAPDHKSILTELVRRYTRMQVFEVVDGMVVQPDCAYIIPPNRDMAFLNGSLQLIEPGAPRGQRLPIDFFFRSLAQDLHERAICIVLSGTGSDGTLGVRAVKAEGGMVMAQSLESTEYGGMPGSAIATGLVDYELPPAEMPARLLAYAAHAFGKKRRQEPPAPATAESALTKVFMLLRSQTGHDFSLYKQNTILRRIERRMAVQQIENMDGYVRYLRRNAAEVASLFRDLLIGVTGFFRDPEVFAALAEQAVPRLFAGKPAGATVRVWVPGCSTGEEAYSIAILLQEHLEKQKLNFKLQVFATDIDGSAITAARSGIYPASIAADVSPERLARFFSREHDGGFVRINKSIRDMLVFSEQDVIRDPPFSRIDLISCRNLLIYMNAELQKKLIPLFHYSLLPDAFLLLGTSETVGDFQNLFSTVDRKSKLYQRREETTGSALRQSIASHSRTAAGESAAPISAGRGQENGRNRLREITERTMLQHYAAAGVLVDERGEILFLQGRTGLFLEPAQGEAGMNVLKMAREGLRRDLTTVLHKAGTLKKPAIQKGVRVKTNGDFTAVNITALPVAASGIAAPAPPLFLIILEEAPPAEPGVNEPAPAIGEGAADSGTAPDARAASLRQELQAKEEYLQSVIEELETSNEELKSANEEMQSVNEELQSTNEELETSKEELQSVNEELSTVNNEQQAKVAELSRITNDMNNLLASTGIGTIFVDHQLRILRFTPAMTRIINLISTDVGRPVRHIVTNLKNYDLLVEDAQAVLDTLLPKEIEVQTREERWYLMRIVPYRTMENVIEGAVITFTDITDIKIAHHVLRDPGAPRGKAP